MKAVLVIEMPDSCDVCDFTDMANGKIYCGVPGCGKNTEDYIACRAEWCPLVPLPEYDTESYFPDEYLDGYKSGWNACVDAICEKPTGTHE